MSLANFKLKRIASASHSFLAAAHAASLYYFTVLFCLSVSARPVYYFALYMLVLYFTSEHPS